MIWVLQALISAGISLGLGPAAALFRKKNQRQGPEPFQGPTVDEGRSIPVIFGTVKLSAPQVIWYGKVRTADYIPTHGGYTGLVVGEVPPAATAYYTEMWMALCHGQVDELTKIIAADKFDVPFTTDTVMGGERLLIAFTEENLFGGILKEGGLIGGFEFYKGSTTQEASPTLSSGDRLGTGVTAPALRGICHAVFTETYVGTSPVMKPFAFVIRRCPDPLEEPTLANINGGANPAFAIREILTDAIWGRGVPAERIDDTAILAAATTLKDEGLGISLNVGGETVTDALIDEILDHIDGVLFIDHSTGLWTLRLARADYDPDDVPVFTREDCDKPKFERTTWNETVNEVKVTYTGDDYKDAVAQAQDLANFEARGGQKDPETVDFRGITDKAVAHRLAMRELRARSLPLAKLRITINRKASTLRIADVFKLTWSPYGITSMIFRVLAVNRGTFEEGKIEIEACEDVFGIGYSAFADPGPTNWEEPTIQRDETPIEGVSELPAMQDQIDDLDDRMGSAESSLVAHGISIAGLAGAVLALEGRADDLEDDVEEIGGTVFDDVVPRVSALEGLWAPVSGTPSDGVYQARGGPTYLPRHLILEASDYSNVIESRAGSDLAFRLSSSSDEVPFRLNVGSSANLAMRVDLDGYVEITQGLFCLGNAQFDANINANGSISTDTYVLAGTYAAAPVLYSYDWARLNPVGGFGALAGHGDGDATFGTSFTDHDGVVSGGFNAASLLVGFGLSTPLMLAWTDFAGDLQPVSQVLIDYDAIAFKGYLYIPMVL